MEHAKDIFKCLYLALPVSSCGQNACFSVLGRELVGSARHADKEYMFLTPSPVPQGPRPQGFNSSSVLHRARILGELLPGFKQLQRLCQGLSSTSKNFIHSTTGAKEALVWFQTKPYQRKRVRFLQASQGPPVLHNHKELQRARLSCLPSSRLQSLHP